MLELVRRTALLAKYTPKVEPRGPDLVPYINVDLEVDGSVDDLASFGPSLRASWYDESNSPTPTLRTPEVPGPFDVDGALVGAMFTLHYGASGKSDMKLGGCKVSRYQLDPQEGGTVKILCRVRCYPDDKEVGKFHRLQRAQIEISIEPAQSELSLTPPVQRDEQAAQPVH